MALRLPSLALVLAIGLFWGLNWPAVKIILGEWPPWTLRAVGLSSGGLGLAAIVWAMGQRVVPPRGERWRLAAAGLLTVLGFNIFAAFGQLHSATSNAAIIAFTMPMWAAALSMLMLGEQITASRLASLALGGAGLAALAWGDFAAMRSDPLGPVFMLSAAICWAAGTVALKAGDWWQPPLGRAAWMVLCSAAPTVIIALVVEQPWEAPALTTATAWTLAYHIAFPMIFCHAAWLVLVDRLPATTAAIGTLLVPVVGVLSAALILGDALTLARLLALGLVLGSICLTFGWRRSA
jgi:drug/metabolite transporter (DMT)-like permease